MKRRTSRARITLIGYLALSASLTANSTTVAANSAVVNEIRSTTVINLCNMYRGMFENILAMQNEPGCSTDLLFDVAQAEQDRRVESFLTTIAEKVARTRNPRSQAAILSSTADFTQPCYNAVAASYDTSLLPPQQRTTPAIPATEPSQPQQADALPQDGSSSHSNTHSRSYSNQRR